MCNVHGSLADRPSFVLDPESLADYWGNARFFIDVFYIEYTCILLLVFFFVLVASVASGRRCNTLPAIIVVTTIDTPHRPAILWSDYPL